MNNILVNENCVCSLLEGAWFFPPLSSILFVFSYVLERWVKKVLSFLFFFFLCNTLHFYIYNGKIWVMLWIKQTFIFFCNLMIIGVCYELGKLPKVWLPRSAFGRVRWITYLGSWVSFFVSGKNGFVNSKWSIRTYRSKKFQQTQPQSSNLFTCFNFFFYLLACSLFNFLIWWVDLMLRFVNITLN